MLHDFFTSPLMQAYPIIWPALLIVFAINWFYWITKLMYPNLGPVWELVVAVPAGASGLAGMMVLFTSGDTQQLLAGIAILLIFANWWKARVAPTQNK